MLGDLGLAWDTNKFGVTLFAIILLASLIFIVLFNEAHRRIPVQYARTSFRGGRMYRQTGGTHIPLKVKCGRHDTDYLLHVAGHIPGYDCPIFYESGNILT